MAENAQTIFYLGFVVIFQLLTDTLRVKEEFYLDKAFSDTSTAFTRAVRVAF